MHSTTPLSRHRGHDPPNKVWHISRPDSITSSQAYRARTGPGGMAVSRMIMSGAGRALLKQMMKEKSVESAEVLLAIAKTKWCQAGGVQYKHEGRGIEARELTDGIEVAGSASCLIDASRSGCTLFI